MDARLPTGPVSLYEENGRVAWAADEVGPRGGFCRSSLDGAERRAQWNDCLRDLGGLNDSDLTLSIDSPELAMGRPEESGGGGGVMPGCRPDGPQMVNRPDLVGRTVSAARRSERFAGHSVRNVGHDGSCSYTSDQAFDRVSVYAENGIIVWAQMF